jgi:hypothetical protein
MFEAELATCEYATTAHIAATRAANPPCHLLVLRLIAVLSFSVDGGE